MALGALGALLGSFVWVFLVLLAQKGNHFETPYFLILPPWVHFGGPYENLWALVGPLG